MKKTSQVPAPKTPRSRPKATPKKPRTSVDSESDSSGPEGLLESPSVKRSSNKRPRPVPKKSSYAETPLIKCAGHKDWRRREGLVAWKGVRRLTEGSTDYTR